MNDNPYKVFGVGISTMLGRERLFEELCQHLTKSRPDHMCVVGPPMFGKSVLLNHLACHFNNRGDQFVTSVYWDLRHVTPLTDDQFRRRFAQRVKIGLQSVRSELAEYLELEDEGISDLLHLVFDEMQSKEVRLLAVLDGFDHVLKGSGITRNLWDELLSLCRMTSLRLVTGSRSRLRELCKTEESRTSDFWEIFYDTPLQVGCFEEHDWDGFLKPFGSRGVKFDGSAKKEISNWTGGVPVLAVALAGRLLVETSDGATLSKQDVDDVAKATFEERRGLLEALWDGCDMEIRSDLAELAGRDVPRSEISDGRRRDLELRGFARSSGNKLRSSCRLMAQYARQQADEVNNLQRLFGSAERFEVNIRSLLELRLSQITAVDSRLLGFVKNAVRELHPDPTQSTTWARSIAERALDLIWKAELPPDRSLPDEWKFVGIEFDERGKLPRRRGRQCGILRRITGTEEHDPVSKFITRPTSLLVDHIQSVGDFGQHRQGITVSTLIAASFCLSAIALCESLSNDLATHKDAATGENREPDAGP